MRCESAFPFHFLYGKFEAGWPAARMLPLDSVCVNYTSHSSEINKYIYTLDRAHAWKYHYSEGRGLCSQDSKQSYLVTLVTCKQCVNNTAPYVTFQETCQGGNEKDSPSPHCRRCPCHRWCSRLCFLNSLTRVLTQHQAVWWSGALQESGSVALNQSLMEF